VALNKRPKQQSAQVSVAADKQAFAPAAPAHAAPRKRPPRPLGEGDIVTAYSRHLREWTVAQITTLDAAHATAGILELDWSGPRPTTVEELGDVQPLVLTHHSHNGRRAYTNMHWLLPRGYQVIGQLPLLVSAPSNSYSAGWKIGVQLAMQRRWDGGDLRPWSDPSELHWTGAECTKMLSREGEPRLDILQLNVDRIEQLDCQPLVLRFPNLVELQLDGDLGTLQNADQLNRLNALRWLLLTDLFGMTAADALQPASSPELELLWLHSVPKEYADASKARWRNEIRNGTDLAITSPREPDWLAENRDNPLREWDGRRHISKAVFTKSVAQYTLTRRAVQASLAHRLDEDELHQIGRDFGEAFNRLDSRRDFIETEEREDLFAALARIAHEMAGASDVDTVKRALWNGADAIRAW
jgi:hypothetical protein